MKTEKEKMDKFLEDREKSAEFVKSTTVIEIPALIDKIGKLLQDNKYSDVTRKALAKEFGCKQWEIRNLRNLHFL